MRAVPPARAGLHADAGRRKERRRRRRPLWRPSFRLWHPLYRAGRRKRRTSGTASGSGGEGEREREREREEEGERDRFSITLLITVDVIASLRLSFYPISLSCSLCSTRFPLLAHARPLPCPLPSPLFSRLVSSLLSSPLCLSLFSHTHTHTHTPFLTHGTSALHQPPVYNSKQPHLNPCHRPAFPALPPLDRSVLHLCSQRLNHARPRPPLHNALSAKTTRGGRARTSCARWRRCSRATKSLGRTSRSLSRPNGEALDMDPAPRFQVRTSLSLPRCHLSPRVSEAAKTYVETSTLPLGCLVLKDGLLQEARWGWCAPPQLARPTCTPHLHARLAHTLPPTSPALPPPLQRLTLTLLSIPTPTLPRLNKAWFKLMPKTELRSRMRPDGQHECVLLLDRSA